MRTVKKAGQLAGQDGKAVRIAGTYRRWVEQDKKGREFRITGFAVVELADGESVQIGETHRSKEEMERHDGMRVAVTGQLAMPRRVRSEEARPDPLPILREPGPVELL